MIALERDPALLDDLAAVVARLRGSTLQVRGEGRSGGCGAGIVWTQGLVVTNAHVATQRTLTVESADRVARQARVAVADPRRDLAVLEADTDGFVPVESARTDRLRPGALVIAVGSPLGLNGVVTAGVIHQVARRRGRPALILADVRLFPGNSGGPLADVHGRVIGVNTMVIRGLAGAIPIDAVERFVHHIARAA